MFNRTSKGNELTEYGEYLKNKASTIVYQFDILTEENVLYIFPIISGEIEMGKLMILMSINSFLLVVFFLSVKETRGMYK